MPLPPALRKKQKDDPYAAADEAPKWARRTKENIGGTWNTYDADTDTFTYDSQYQAGNTEPKMFESDDWTGKRAPAGAGDDGNTFKSRFVDDDDIMDDELPRDDFSVRNADVLGLGASKSVINVQIGDAVFRSDTRSSTRSSNATYRGAQYGQQQQQQQQLKKRHVEERNRRLEEKHAEEEAWYARVQEWLSLSAEQQESIKEQRRQDRQDAMELFRMTVVEDMPEDVLGDGIDLINLDGDDFVSNPYDSGRTSRNSYGSRQSSDSRRYEHGSESRFSRSSYGSRGHYASQPAQSRRGSHSSRASSQRTVSHRGGRSRSPPSVSSSSNAVDLGRGLFNRPASSYAGSDVAPGGSLTTPRTFTLPQRSRHAVSTPSRAGEAPLRVEYHPVLLPVPEDLEHRAVYDTAQNQELYGSTLERIVDLNNRKGRMVTVRLDPKVTTPFPEAITDRIWGGMVQEIYFDAKSRHAIIIFVTVSGCAAFLRHWRAIRDHGGDMEYRRLQVAVEWYDDGEPAAVLPAQRNILKAICFRGATRVLLVRNIDRGIRKADAERGFRSSVGFDRVICRGRLVVPAKLYEKQNAKSNSLVIEFAAVRDAVDVLEEINAGRMGPDFAGCVAEFARDPVDRPPVARDYCKCRWCVKDRAAKADADEA